MANFNDRFKELRKEKDLSQKELGDILGYSESTISLYESGKREPKNAGDLIKIANFFDVSVDYLLGKIDVKNYIDTVFSGAGKISEEYNPELNIKDKKDIEKMTDKFLEGLEGGAMLNGEILDDSDLELFKQAVKNGLQYAKISNKKKFTPKKYRK